MLLLVVVAVVLFLLTVGLITALATIAKSKTKAIEPVIPQGVRLSGSGELSVEPDSGPLSLAPDGHGDYLSWNDNTFQALKALYPDLDGNLNDYLYRYQQDNS